MDTCLTLTELNPHLVAAGLKKVKANLARFSFVEDENEDYRQTVTNSAQHWSEFLQTGLSEEIFAMGTHPYEWLSLSGRIELADTHHSLQLFLYPLSKSTATMSISLSSTIYEAMYSFRPPHEGAIDLDVKLDVVSFLLLMATTFSGKAFSLQPLTDFSDLTPALRIVDIKKWLVDPTDELIDRLPFLFVGIENSLVDRRQVERNWPAKQLLQSSSGFLIYDGITPPPA